VNEERLLECLTLAERRAIEEHKYYLSQRRGRDVGLGLAVRHWLRFYAGAWRRERMRWDAEEQRREILAHKWIESEKAGRDLGEEAVRDWICRFAETWRSNRESGPAG